VTKREAENYARLSSTMIGQLGVSRDDFDALLRIEKTLHRWGERECNGEVEVDDDGKAWTFYGDFVEANDPRRKHRTANRERGALKRLDAILARYPNLAYYHQVDPRGCALYVYEKAALNVGVPRDTIESCYSSVGVALCY